MLRPRSSTDAFPSGLAVAMAPAIVDWKRSSLGQGEEDYYLVRNVNFGGNPVGGSTLLVTARIPCAGVARAEWVMARVRALGQDTPGGHGFLRLVFREGARPAILDRDGEPFADDPHVDDLVFSYEAWRPPGRGFDPKAGLDPETYALTMRCFSGPQRFLEDALQDRWWACYPIALPDVPGAGDDLLHACLVMGDSLARHTVQYVLDHPGTHFGARPIDYPAPDPDDIEKLRSLFTTDGIPADPIAELMGGEISYHLLKRSCITMAMATLEVGFRRIHSRHPQLGDRPLLKATPTPLPAWTQDLAHGDMQRVLVRLPAALYWIAKHSTVVPARAHLILDEAGMLVRDEHGQIVSHEYRIDDRTPYGRLEDHLID
ncbi:hypothetical protein K8I85_09500 [bacterium]|nr:hypothetical protein [bacterium]